ncbi:MAG: hypothetical protein KAR21_16545, partial [Spirochaetales bacterium]|nr:hypothetical protein [Spirochaetales bacterium]
MSRNNTLLFGYIIPVIFIIPLTAYLLKVLNLYYTVSPLYLLFLIIETAVFVPVLSYLCKRSAMSYRMRTFLVVGLVNFGFCLLFSNMDYLLNIILIVPGIILCMISADMVQMVYLNDQCLKLIDMKKDNPAVTIRKNTEFMSENYIRINTSTTHIFRYSIVRLIIVLPLMVFRIYPGVILSFFLLLAAAVEFWGMGILRNYMHDRLFHNNNLINDNKLIFQRKTMVLIILGVSFLAAMVLGRRFSLLHSDLLVQFWNWFISLFNTSGKPVDMNFQEDTREMWHRSDSSWLSDMLAIEPLLNINWELINRIGLYLLIAIILIFILYPLSNRKLYKKIAEGHFLKKISERIRTLFKEITGLFKNAFVMFSALFSRNINK